MGNVAAERSSAKAKLTLCSYKWIKQSKLCGYQKLAK
jgi:hypothetical protein